jgi:hypothetical protein
MVNGGCVRYEFESRLSFGCLKDLLGFSPGETEENYRNSCRLFKSAELGSVTLRCLMIFSVE